MHLRTAPRSIVFAALFAAVLPVWAGTPINESRPLAPDGRVDIDNVKGRIVVRAWDRAEVKIGGILGEGVEKLAIEGDRDNLSVRVVYPQGKGWFGWGGDGGAESTDLEVTLPTGAEVNVDSVSAGVDIRGVAGKRLSVDAVSGDVTVAAARPGEAEFDSVSGDLVLELETGSVSAESVSGDIEISGRVDGRVSAETVSGSIRVNAGQLSRFSASSVSGDAELHGALAAGGRLQAETLSGDLTVVLPRGTSAKVTVSTFSGGIRSDAGKVAKPEHGPGASLETTLGNGDGEVRLESFSGDVQVRLE